MDEMPGSRLAVAVDDLDLARPHVKPRKWHPRKNYRIGDEPDSGPIAAGGWPRPGWSEAAR